MSRKTQDHDDYAEIIAAESDDGTEMAPIVRWYLRQVAGIRPELNVTSFLVSPLTLLVFRALVAVYLSFILITVLVLYWGNGSWFSFFTNLSFLGACLFFWSHAIMSFRYVFYGWLPPADSWYYRLFFTYFGALFTTHFVVVLVFWTLLNPHLSTQAPIERMTTTSQHGVQIISLIVDFMVAKSSISVVFPLHWIIVNAIAITYFCWALVYSYSAPIEVNGVLHPNFPYPFLDFSNQVNGVVVILALLLFSLMHALVHGLQWLRSRLIHRNRVPDNRKPEGAVVPVVSHGGESSDGDSKEMPHSGSEGSRPSAENAAAAEHAKKDRADPDETAIPMETIN